MDKETQDFCWRYDATVAPSTRMRRRLRRSTMQDCGTDPGLFYTLPAEDVACVEIHMPEDRFRPLMEHDHWLEREFRQGDISNGAVVRIVREYERECRIRHEHPGVQAAWEQYQIMLSMVDTAS
jgi:hypothetical protein